MDGGAFEAPSFYGQSSSFPHAEVPDRTSSRSFSREGVNFRYDPRMALSVFRPFRNFQPDRTVRVGFRLSFTKHKDPKGSNFTIGVSADGRSPSPGGTHDVWWK